MLQEVSEMKNTMVTATSLFSREVNHALQCARLCRQYKACESVVLEESGHTATCRGYSGIYSSGTESTGCSYFVVL